ncbi:deoxynucleoside kinase [Desulfosediminicola sp.]|uniref:deoxynucleoside kinase n=1 Tax=Desulfosediminicola sp. TaxID=2886825 RepID=UPI003AF2724A
MKRTEICGNIASGKTTLCQNLFNIDRLPIYEKFQDNPFYKAFYLNPSAYSFETELTFLLQHYHSIKESSSVPHLVCDYSLLLDMAYADVNLTENRHRIFFEVVLELLHEIGHPQTIIHLTCPEEILLDRIIARSRSAETSITLDYLKAISEALSKRVNSISSKTKVITIKSDLVDFRMGIDCIPELKRL